MFNTDKLAHVVCYFFKSVNKNALILPLIIKFVSHNLIQLICSQ